MFYHSLPAPLKADQHREALDMEAKYARKLANMAVLARHLADMVADAILELCRDEIGQYIKQGPLDEPARSERNGLVLAFNLFAPGGDGKE